MALHFGTFRPFRALENGSTIETMKHKLLATFMALTLAFSAMAAPPKPQPIITVSCNACALDEHISYTGSGFKQGISVYLSVEGPGSRAINVNIDSSGGFDVDFGGLLDYQKGSYTVTAYSVGRKGATPLASSAFTVGL